MKIPIKDLEIGNKVWCGGNSGFCYNDIVRVNNIEYNYDEDAGEKYKVIILKDGSKFDSRDGKAMTPPTAYFISETEQ